MSHDGARMLAGFHAVAARLKHDAASVEALYVDAQRHDGRMKQLLALAEQAGVRAVAADARRLRGLAGEVPHQGVVALCRATVRTAATLGDVVTAVQPTTLLLLLDGVTDPRNLGACLRTADAAPVVAKAAAGAADTVPLIAVTNLVRAMDELREAGVWIAGAAGEADRMVYELDLTGPIAWALGAEGEGLRRLTRERCDYLARIPMRGQVQSLNVSVATGICLFETQRQRAARAAPRGTGSAGAQVRQA
jgi:23S rRNA (guanosine2251-2'-O)-methyltransferase